MVSFVEKCFDKMAAEEQEITLQLLRWSRGEADALETLIPLVYPELRRVARRYMRRENPGHTLQTSALINEAYMRLIDRHEIDWKDRAHFYAVAAQIMRHILVDHARRYAYKKRGGGATHVPLESASLIKEEKAAELLALDEALNGLERIDPRKARIVEMRFYGGMTVEETAEALTLSPITIKREWRTARAWLLREVSREPS